MGDCQVYPDKGTVCFSAGLHAWAFTLKTFAEIYAKKFGVPKEKMMEKLWGDNFFDPKEKKWTKKNTGAATCSRAFVQFIYNPIKKVIDACMNEKRDEAFTMLMIHHLPSPLTAQKYRTETLYEGPMDDKYADAMNSCDPNGPLMVYVSKMIPSQDKGRFFAFGRVFSGTIAAGMKVRIMGPNYIPG